MKKLWVDDIRPAPDKSWDIAFSYHTAIYLLQRNNYDVVSLDHDLGDIHEGREMTGYDVLMFMVEKKETGGYFPPEVRVHTANPPARIKMIHTIDRYWNDRGRVDNIL